MKKVYICSPCRGDYEKNIARAQEFCREAAEMGVLPIAPHVYLTQFLDDTVPAERELGLSMGLEILRGCDEIWVYGIEHPSAGMAAEIELAKKIGIPVMDAVDVYGSGGSKAAAPPEQKKLGSVTIHIPAFRAMAVCNQNLDHGPLSIELAGETIMEIAQYLSEHPGENTTIGGDRNGW